MICEYCGNHMIKNSRYDGMKDFNKEVCGDNNCGFYSLEAERRRRRELHAKSMRNVKDKARLKKWINEGI